MEKITKKTAEFRAAGRGCAKTAGMGSEEAERQRRSAVFGLQDVDKRSP